MLPLPRRARLAGGGTPTPNGAINATITINEINEKYTYFTRNISTPVLLPFSAATLTFSIFYHLHTFDIHFVRNQLYYIGYEFVYNFGSVLAR